MGGVPWARDVGTISCRHGLRLLTLVLSVVNGVCAQNPGAPGGARRANGTQ